MIGSHLCNSRIFPVDGYAWAAYIGSISTELKGAPPERGRRSKMQTVLETITPAASRPWGIVLPAAALAAWAEFNCGTESAEKIIARIGKPRYSDGTAMPQLWFRRKADMLNAEKILASITGLGFSGARYR